jgi:hypothetical protein
VPSLLDVPDVSVTLTVGDGGELTVMVLDTEAEQLVAVSVTLTVYVVFPVGDTTGLFAVPLMGLAHAYVAPVAGLAVSVTAAPLQVVPSSEVVPEFSSTLMVGLGKLFTVILLPAVAEQFVAVVVTVTTYEVVDAGDTDLLFPVPPTGLAHA